MFPKTKYGRIIALIATSDMLYTAFLLLKGIIKEYNPLFSIPIHYLGIYGFILTKSFFIFVPIYLIEMYRTKYPKFINIMLLICIIVYVLIFVFGIIIVNR